MMVYGSLRHSLAFIGIHSHFKAMLSGKHLVLLPCALGEVFAGQLLKSIRALPQCILSCLQSPLRHGGGHVFKSDSFQKRLGQIE